LNVIYYIDKSTAMGSVE